MFLQILPLFDINIKDTLYIAALKILKFKMTAKYLDITRSQDNHKLRTWTVCILKKPQDQIYELVI